ncbi:MAG TPA: DinB family protein [Symbiobacteriaceae bacterium]|nr:DinB family protein [Symbiobacteriaceae bacterium]
MNMKEIWLQSLSSERRLTRETIAAMKDGDVQFKPTEEQMPFGLQALHIVSCQKTLVEAFRTNEWHWEQGYDLVKFPTLEAILTAFDQGQAAETGYYESLEPEEFGRIIKTPWGSSEPVIQMLYSFLAHEAHHRGQMVTYLRLKGMVPPQY